MSDLLITPLDSLHHELEGKMVAFAGYSMPVQYPSGIMQEHIHTRSKASVFDVSHMGQLLLHGEGIDKALEKILPINVIDLKANHQRYGFFTLENGGILDDLMLARIDDKTFYMVINASRKEVDIPHLKKHLNGFTIEELNDHALIALQGPLAAEVLARFIPDVKTMKFMENREFSFEGHLLRISRSGYSGEDGYEISIPKDFAVHFTKALLNVDGIEMAGLGARDSLRLEAGLCLYGNDLTENTNPIEADLLWAMQKIRKQGGERAGGFIGADVILPLIEAGTKQVRVGLSVDGRVPVRAHTPIIDAAGNEIGEVSSGGFGATVAAPIAMGYVNRELADIGTELFVNVRNKQIRLEVTALPFVKQNYYRG